MSDLLKPNISPRPIMAPETDPKYKDSIYYETKCYKEPFFR